MNSILNGLVFEKIGRYTLRLQVRNGDRWATVHEIPLEIGLNVPLADLKGPDANPPVIKEKKHASQR